jgi:hypothetical protein
VDLKGTSIKPTEQQVAERAGDLDHAGLEVAARIALRRRDGRGS